MSFLFNKLNTTFYEDVIYLVPEGFSEYVDVFPSTQNMRKYY